MVNDVNDENLIKRIDPVNYLKNRIYDPKWTKPEKQKPAPPTISFREILEQEKVKVNET